MTDDRTKCVSCGKPYDYHDGIVTTCAKLQSALALLREVDACGVSWRGRGYREVQIPSSLMEEIRKVIQ